MATHAPEKIIFHASYLTNREAYQRHRDWLESTKESLAKPKYVHRTYLETHDDRVKPLYQERLDLLDTDNNIKSLLTVHYSELTKEEPTWSGLESTVAQAIRKNIDGKGKSAWLFTKEVTWQLLWAGFAPVEVFSPESKSDNLLDAQRTGERSFSRLYEPDSAVAWEYFDDDGPRRGQFRSVTFLNSVVFDGKKAYQTYKHYWIPDEAPVVVSEEPPPILYKCQILRSKKTVEQIQNEKSVEVEPDPVRGLEKTGAIPFIPVYFFGDPDKGVENTTIYQAVFDAITQLNKQSMYDTTTRYNHYPRHIISGSDNPEQDSMDLGPATLGVTRGKIDVHTLEAADPVALWKDIRRLEQSIRYKVLLMINQQANPESREQPSVEAKRADAEVREKFYNEMTDLLEYALGLLFGVYHAAFEAGSIPENVEVSFRRDFALKDSETERQEKAEKFSRADRMGEAGKKFQKRLFINDVMDTKLLVTDKEDEALVRKEIIDAILAMPEAEMRSPLAEARERRLGRPDDEEDEQRDEAAEQEREAA